MRRTVTRLLQLRAATKTKVCCLSRDVYQKFSAARSTAKLSQNMRLISSIPVFSNLSMKERGKLADPELAPGQGPASRQEQ